MALSDDEYTCLMIMKDGENLIRMKNTRWDGALGKLHEQGFVKLLAGHANNFVITQVGLQELVAHEHGLDGVLTQVITGHIAVNNARMMMQDKMRTAVDALVEAADIASRTTGESKKDALRKIAHEVLEHALGRIS